MLFHGVPVLILFYFQIPQGFLTLEKVVLKEGFEYCIDHPEAYLQTGERTGKRVEVGCGLKGSVQVSHVLSTCVPY